MVIRLTASCNNRCFFCMVDEEIARREFRPFDEIACELDRALPDEEVDIFGGEPTIDPVFWDVLEHALRTGRTVTLASNVRLFSHQPAAERLAELGEGRVEVRTTLMGHTSELHDRLNGVKRGAFVQTTQGIRNLTELGVPLQTNIVVLEENVDHLLSTALAALSAGSPKIKFSGAIRTASFLSSVPDPAKVRDRLRSVVPLLRALGANIGLEKFSPCVVPESLDLLRRESDPEAESAGWYRKVAACEQCVLVTTCAGAEQGALERHGEGWVEPVGAIPDALVEEVLAQQLETFAPSGKPYVRVLFDDDPLAAVTSVAEFSARNPQLHLIAG